MAKVIAHFKDVDAQCTDEVVHAGDKKQGILIAHRAGPFEGVILVFNRATHQEIEDLARMLNKLGLNEARVEKA